jgi:hypothetical protein
MVQAQLGIMTIVVLTLVEPELLEQVKIQIRM